MWQHRGLKCGSENFFFEIKKRIKEFNLKLYRLINFVFVCNTLFRNGFRITSISPPLYTEGFERLFDSTAV